MLLADMERIALIAASSVSVRRGRRVLVEHCNLSLTAGRILQLHGANGSGKTSLLRVLAGIAAPRHGRVERSGPCAFVPERVEVSPRVHCGEWLEAMHRLRRTSAVDWADVITSSGMERSVLATAASRASKGMLQRVVLIEALHAGATTLMLDEPFSGLDDAGRGWLLDRLQEHCARSGSAIVVDHSGTLAGSGAAHGELHLQARRCEIVALEPARRRAMLVNASSPGGATTSRVVAESAVDDHLRELLAADWHIDEVRPYD
jgi:heme exporter protein A